MKPLGDRTKTWAQAHLVRGPLRRIFSPAYRAVLQAQATAAGIGARPDPLDTSTITAVIKTFERPRACGRLVASLKRLHPNLAIIVVDDGRDPRPIAGTTHISLPFDSGVGAGRQAGLDRVETPFVLNLDDDFLAWRGTNLAAALDALARYPQLDLVGGTVIDLPLLIIHDFRTATLFPTSAQPKLPLGTRLGPVEVLDKVPNFFLARTEAVRAVGWNPVLKRVDHADFFTRARGRIASGIIDTFRILHLRDPFDAAYRVFRDDAAANLAYLRTTYFGTGDPSP